MALNARTMRINTDNRIPFVLQGSIIKKVDMFCYLASIIAKDGGTEEDIKHLQLI